MTRYILGQSQGRHKSTCRFDIDTYVGTADSVVH